MRVARTAVETTHTLSLRENRDGTVMGQSQEVEMSRAGSSLDKDHRAKKRKEDS